MFVGSTLTLGNWFLLEPFWLIAAVSVASVLLGIGLRKLLKKEKILALFIPLIVYLSAEYLAQGSTSVVYTVLGGVSAFVFLGVALPSALMPWFRKR